MSVNRIASRVVPFDPKGPVMANEAQALDASIGDARIVLLGEPSHGDGAAFAAKARLVEHLHRHRGFDVLAFEADFFALDRAWRGAPDPSGVDEVARHVYRFWRDSPSIQPLWRLVQERFDSRRPLVVAGIDPRHSGGYAKRSVAEELDAFLDHTRIERPAEAEWSAFTNLLIEMLEQEYRHRVSATDRVDFMNTLWMLRERITVTDSETAFWRQELSNLMWTGRSAWTFEGRDEGMAENLAWLARERFPEARIVVWAHNFHVVKDADLLAQVHPAYARERRLSPGSLLASAAKHVLQEEVCSIAVVSGQGRHAAQAWQGDFETLVELEPPPEGSLEAALLQQGIEAGYVSFKEDDPASASTFTMSGTEHGLPLEAPWGMLFDGVVFLRDASGLM